MRTANTENTSSVEFFARCKTEPGLEVFLRLLLQPLSLSPTSCTRFHLNRSIFSNSTNLSFNSSDSSFASITEKNLAPAVLLSSTVNPIIQSTSHPNAAARFWSHLCSSKVPRDTGGAWDPRLDALWRLLNPIRWVPPFKTPTASLRARRPEIPRVVSVACPSL